MNAQTHQAPPQPPAWLTRQDQRELFARIVAALPRPWPSDPSWPARVAFTAAFPSRPRRLH